METFSAKENQTNEYEDKLKEVLGPPVPISDMNLDAVEGFTLWSGKINGAELVILDPSEAVSTGWLTPDPPTQFTIYAQSDYSFDLEIRMDGGSKGLLSRLKLFFSARETLDLEQFGEDVQGYTSSSKQASTFVADNLNRDVMSDLKSFDVVRINKHDSSTANFNPHNNDVAQLENSLDVFADVFIN